MIIKTKIEYEIDLIDELYKAKDIHEEFYEQFRHYIYSNKSDLIIRVFLEGIEGTEECQSQYFIPILKSLSQEAEYYLENFPKNPKEDKLYLLEQYKLHKKHLMSALAYINEIVEKMEKNLRIKRAKK